MTVENQDRTQSLKKFVLITTMVATVGTLTLTADAKSLDRGKTYGLYKDISGTGSINTAEYYRDSTPSTSSGGSEQKHYDAVTQQLAGLSENKALLFKELVKDFMSLEDQTLQDPDLNEASFVYGLQFLFQMPNELAMPAYDVHPDGEFAFVWRNQNVGIMTVSFSKTGSINYASYSPSTNARHKGLLSFENLHFNQAGTKKASDEDTILFTLIKKFS